MAGKEMVLADIRGFLERAQWGRLATNGPGGPYITPLHYVLEGDRIYFHCALKGCKLDNINHDNRVCFEVSEMFEIKEHASPCKFSTSYKSVLVFGLAELINDLQEKVKILNLISQKYSAANNLVPIMGEQSKSVAVLVLNIAKISGKEA